MTSTLAAPRIGVVITNYNYAAYIGRAIESVLAQGTAARIVVVDDGSTDGSVASVQAQFGSLASLQVIARQNAGQLAAMVVGVAALAASAVEVVCFLDADDAYCAGYFQALLAAYDTQPAVDFVFANMRYQGQRSGTYWPETDDRLYGLSPLITLYRAPYVGSPTSALSMRLALARRILHAVPEDFLPEWKTRADDWLVYGSALLGACKYFLAAAHVHYWVHGSNQFMDKVGSDPAARLRYQLRKQAMFEHFRQRARLDVSCYAFAKAEFKTLPTPRFHELLAYLGLLWHSRLSVLQCLEHAASMLGHYLTARRRR